MRSFSLFVIASVFFVLILSFFCIVSASEVSSSHENLHYSFPQQQQIISSENNILTELSTKTTTGQKQHIQVNKEIIKIIINNIHKQQ